MDEPARKAFLSRISLMASLFLDLRRWNDFTSTPSSMAPHAIRRAIFSALSHMVSQTVTTLSFASNLDQRA